jgi:hypothetical protein
MTEAGLRLSIQRKGAWFPRIRRKLRVMNKNST